MEKGDLKTLEIQPQQNVYMVSGKRKMMKTIHLFLYNNEDGEKKLLMLLKSKNGAKLTIKEEEKQSVFVRYFQNYRS